MQNENSMYVNIAILFIILYLVIKAVYSFVFWLTHRKPLTDEQVAALAEARKCNYINTHFCFSENGFKINPKYRESLNKEGRWDRVSISYPVIGSAIAELLRFKRHEWSIMILANEKEAKYIWANKGDDNSSCYSKANFLHLLMLANTNECNTVLHFHNHPHTQERYWNLLVPSETDLKTLKTLTDYFNKAGLNFIDGIVSQGKYTIFGYGFSPEYRPKGTTVEEISLENNKSKKGNYKLHRELKKNKYTKISEKLFG